MSLVPALPSQIVELVRAEALPLGAHLRAQWLADRLRVSRSPVNEALELLRSQGVVRREPNRGYFIAAPLRIDARAVAGPAGAHHRRPATRDQMTATPDIVTAFAPTGRLRASINTGNPILAAPDGAGSARGVSVDLARGFAQRLGVPLELVVFDTAGKSVDAVTNEQADIGFFAIDPKRGEGIHFTGPYVLIEGCYAVRDASPITDMAQVDQPGVRVVVGKGSAYDLYLSREIRQATLLRAPSSPAVVEHFLATGAEVAAGVKQQLEADAERLGGLRLLPGRFMEIRQAMGCPRGRGEAAAGFLAAYVEEMKKSGFVAAALARHHVTGVTVAPAAE